MLTSEQGYVEVGDPPSKRRILEEALRLFAGKGIDGVTVREIGTQAGYTNAALFKFFPTKDALALYLFERCYARLFERVAAAVEGAAGFDARLHGVVAVFVAQIGQDADAFLFVQDNLRSLWPKVSRSVRRRSILGLLRTVLEGGVGEGKVRQGTELNLLVAAIAGTLQQFARMYRFGEFRSPAAAWAGELEGVVRRIVAP